MSSSDHSVSAEQSSTPPSFMEVRAGLLADESLPIARRRDMASALMSAAKALGRLPETILADPATLRPQLAGLTPAMVGLKPGRWRNILSLISAALAYVGIVVVQGRIRDNPSPGWLAILDLLPTGAGRHFHAWRFARYCSRKGIEPAAVNDSAITDYQQDLTTQSLVSEPARAAREVARFWNQAAVTRPTWPQQRLTVPDNRLIFAPPWDAFPASLQRDAEAWCAGLSNADPFMEEPFSPLRPASVESRRKQLRAYLGALVLGGVDPAELVDLAAVVTLARAKVALRYFWEKAGRRATTYTYQQISMVLMIARHYAQLPAEDVDRLAAMAKQLRPGFSGMTARNIACLRQLEDPEKLRSLVNLPEVLLAEARRLGAPSVSAALEVQTAVAIDVLLHVPMRLGNLRKLRIGVHLLRNDASEMHITIKPDEVKNEVAIEARLPEGTAKLIAIYIDRYRALLAPGGGDWLFPGMWAHAPKSDQGLRSQIQKALAIRCGMKFHPHAFRHLAAYITLKHNPGAHGQVQRILGHKSVHSTMTFYSGLETSTALEHYDSLIAGHRTGEDLRDQPGVRSGRSR